MQFYQLPMFFVRLLIYSGDKGDRGEDGRHGSPGVQVNQKKSITLIIFLSSTRKIY